MLGSILARVVLENRWPAFRTWHVALVCVAGFALVNVVPFVWTFNVATIVPIAMLVVAGFFGLTILGGWALYSLVEKPMMDRFARPRRVPAPVAVAPA